MFNTVITIGALNSIQLEIQDLDPEDVYRPSAYIHDPLGFVHPDGQNFCICDCNECSCRQSGKCSGA